MRTIDQTLLVLTLLIPLFFGLCSLLPIFSNKKFRNVFVLCGLFSTLLINILLCTNGDFYAILFLLPRNIPIIIYLDDVARLFSLLVSSMWLIVGVFSLEYASKHVALQRYFLFYFLTQSAVLSMCFSGSLITMYVCFEMMTLLSMPLVIHNLTKESIFAAKKYLFYSIAGAMLGLFGIIYLSIYSSTDVFAIGGILNSTALENGNSSIYWVLLITIIGFCTKAGMFPMHNWLPCAHPVAPAPASAILSGVIVNAGVLCTIRIIYFVVGSNNIASTWLQYTLIVLALITIFIGSMLAIFQDNLKKRLAFSTVSQISYILLGVFCMNSISLNGAFLHTYFHSIMKSCLFLCAGSFSLYLGISDASKLKSTPSTMQITFICFTICALGLIGIPPFSGFVSKWYIAKGSLDVTLNMPTWIPSLTLLISALLTAVYLLPICKVIFFVDDSSEIKRHDTSLSKPNLLTTMPIVILAILIIFFGLFPNLLSNFTNTIANTLLP